jgi:hypothetical protein
VWCGYGDVLKSTQLSTSEEMPMSFLVIYFIHSYNAISEDLVAISEYCIPTVDDCRKIIAEIVDHRFITCFEFFSGKHIGTLLHLRLARNSERIKKTGFFSFCHTYPNKIVSKHMTPCRRFADLPLM